MKLMICGKGGSGKSTITALLARQYVLEGKRVVVVDTDVSNTGLHHILGTNAPPDLTGYFVGQRSMRDAMREARQKGIPRGTPLLGTWTYDTIPEGFCESSGGIKLVRVGKIQNANQHGKGRWVGLARQFLGGLTLADNERVIIDSDAGVEHLARKLGEACDVLIMVIDPTFESIGLVPTVSLMADELHVPLYFVLNKTTAETLPILTKAVPDPSRILAVFPADLTIREAGFKGEALPGGNPAATAVIQRVEGKEWKG
ncbi:P-loop NTPase [Methanoregula sp. UBA64]|jgi:CO dehydrogenase maturation factor|uniref:ATP-binding protein n=1 Tax=Methanoregula sp. UBA64 TaxID=1915554 RepID=UPI0025FFFA57|nr:P-loop NTPase [Methanoregula sp. UBA64]